MEVTTLVCDIIMTISVAVIAIFCIKESL